MGVEPKIGGKNPKWMVYNGKPYEQMDDLGVPLFLEGHPYDNLRPPKIVSSPKKIHPTKHQIREPFFPVTFKGRSSWIPTPNKILYHQYYQHLMVSASSLQFQLKT